MIIKNGEVFQEDGSFKVQDLYIENGKIAASAEEVTDKTVVDASGLKVIPGLVDVHSHGAFSYDFSDADEKGLHAILKYQKEHGITSYCPTSMTLPQDLLLKIFATAQNAGGNADEAAVVGINMEGPFINPERKGAHDAQYIIKPDVDFFRECNKQCGGLIKLVTLAPEIDGAKEFIEALKDEVTISIGHTTATYDIASDAMEKGADHITHLYNAMPSFSHRETGVIGAAADSNACMAELICDGIHIAPSAVRATFRLLGSERIVLISDSMRATGMENGTYDLGGQTVTMKDKKATLADGTIAGSATNLFDCMKMAMSFGIPEEQAILAATRNPAKSIGIYDTTGSLTPGKKADVLLVDKDYNLKKVL